MSHLIDGRCFCKRCEDRTTDIYRMIGNCWNCHAEPLMFIFRAGDPARPRDCSVCGCYDSAHPVRLATPDDGLPVDFEDGPDWRASRAEQKPTP